MKANIDKMEEIVNCHPLTGVSLFDGYLEQVADILLINGTLLMDPGLVFGKTGIAIFFFHYARYTGNDLFEDYAMELIEATRKQIHLNSPAEYGRGIAGIGSGIDHLIRNAFIEPDEDIFADFDQRMYRAVMYEPHFSFSLYDGIVGYGRYWLCRCGAQDINKQVKETISCILDSITENMEKITEKEQADVCSFLKILTHYSEYSYRADGLMKKAQQQWHLLKNESDDHILGPERLNIRDVVTAYQSQKIDINAETFSGKIATYLEEPVRAVGLDLLNGYAGLGLLMMSGTDNCYTSWMELL